MSETMSDADAASRLWLCVRFLSDLSPTKGLQFIEGAGEVVCHDRQSLVENVGVTDSLQRDFLAGMGFGLLAKAVGAKIGGHAATISLRILPAASLISMVPA